MDFPPFFPGPVDKHMCTQTNRHVHVNVHTMKDKMEVKNEVRRQKLQLTGLVNIGAHQLRSVLIVLKEAVNIVQCCTAVTLPEGSMH